MLFTIHTPASRAREALQAEYPDPPAYAREDVLRAFDDVMNEVDHGCTLIYNTYLDLEMVIEPEAPWQVSARNVRPEGSDMSFMELASEPRWI